MATKKMVRNTVECTIQIGNQEPFTERWQLLSDNTEEGREWAKGFVAQEAMFQYDGSKIANGVPAHILKVQIVKAVFETTEVHQGK